MRDVIEEAPGPVLDVNGWDLRKALRLLAKGNATLVEWLSSPVVYRQDDRFVQRLREVAAAVYQPVRSFHHYYAMGRGNYREYLQGDQVRAKKYLYVLRPLLAAMWVVAGAASAECISRHVDGAVEHGQARRRPDRCDAAG